MSYLKEKNKSKQNIKNISPPEAIDFELKNNIPWFQNSKFNNIYKNILLYVHRLFPGKQIDNKEFKVLFAKATKTENELIDYIYSFKYKTYGYFDHNIRNARHRLVKDGLLESTKGKQPFSSTKKMLDLSDDFSKNVDNFIEFIAMNAGFAFQNISKKEMEHAKKYVDKTISAEEVENLAAIKKLRTKFRESLKEQTKLIFDLQNTEAKSFIIDNNFKYPQAAHIMPVYYLYKSNNFNSIEDPNNGIFLDPNTHVLFDKKDLKFDNNYNLTSKEGVILKLDPKILTPERKIYIDMYIKKMQ